MGIRHSIAMLGAAAIVLVSANAAAFAHAELRRAIPAPGAVVSASPSEVWLYFSEPVEVAFSSVVVRDAAGTRVDKAGTHIDPADRTTMRVSLQPLSGGYYTVVWRVVTADTHRTEGSFKFRVGDAE